MYSHLKLLALATCLLISGAYAQDNQSLYTGLIGVGSNLNSTELGYLPRADVPLQTLIDKTSDGATVTVTLANYALSQPLRISKNITLVGAPFAYIEGQGASQILKIDNPKVSVIMEGFLFIYSESWVLRHLCQWCSTKEGKGID
jgi:hypothetical protein